MISSASSIARVDNWSVYLDALLCSRLSTRFAWGSHDCCLFAADCVLVTTGVDHASEYRGRYNDVRSALRFLVDGGGIESIATRMLGSAQPDLIGACRGDVVTVNASRAGACRVGLAVALSDQLAVMPALRGLAPVRRENWRALWHVGMR